MRAATIHCRRQSSSRPKISTAEETPPARRIVVAFATSPGWAAIHGRGDAHSPFTAALLKYMDTPGLTIQDLLSQMQSAVVELTRGAELPWYTPTYFLGRDIYLAGP